MEILRAGDDLLVHLGAAAAEDGVETVVVVGRVAAVGRAAAAAVVTETAAPPMEVVKGSLFVPMALRPMGLLVLPEAAAAEMTPDAGATSQTRTMSRTRVAAKRRTR